jgi:hypothetical protein
MLANVGSMLGRVGSYWAHVEPFCAFVWAYVGPMLRHVGSSCAPMLHVGPMLGNVEAKFGNLADLKSQDSRAKTAPQATA